MSYMSETSARCKVMIETVQELCAQASARKRRERFGYLVTSLPDPILAAAIHSADSLRHDIFDDEFWWSHLQPWD
jgi:hypothetical protein